MLRRRRLIATCFAMLICIFIFLHFVFFTPVKNSKTFQEVKQWKSQLDFSLPPLRATKHVRQIICDRSHSNFDLCSINGHTLLDPRTTTLYALDPTNSNPPITLLKIRPYPRKADKRAMSSVKELNITSIPPKISCGVTHHSPALAFSAGGYTGNFFCDFSDGFAPFFITINSLFSNRDVVLVISDIRGRWAQKYAELQSRISKHPIIDLNKENVVHCFPSAIVEFKI
ncbi:uncharacterized protein LOC21387743 [Morus notabilis]|nr:uncharacterized protein LOC21387743 [Morus notabilis]